MLNLIIIVIAAAIAVLGIAAYKTGQVKKRTAVSAVIAGVVLVVLSGSFTIIPTGYTGVKTTFGQIDNTVLKNGFNFKIPIVQRISKVNNKQQDKKYEGQIWGEASDKTVVWADNVIVTYQINADSSSYIYANVSNYTQNLIPQTLVNSAVKSAMISLKSDSVTDRTKIESATKTALEKAIKEKYGADTVSVLKVTIDSMDFEESYNKAIADKQIARQEAEKQAIENQKAVDMAKANQEKANVEAQTKKIQAQADADAMVISAQAEAESYRIKSEQITDKLLKKWELDARKAHGWVTVQGANTIVTDK